MAHRFGWCSDRKHGNCRRSYISPVTKQRRYCECDEPSCPCSENPRSEETSDA